MGTRRASVIYIAAVSVGAIALMPPRDARAQVDTVVQVVGAANAVPTGTSLNTFGYDPINDRMFTISTASANQQLRMISNVSGVQSVQSQMGQSAWLLFSKGGNTSFAGGNANCGGILLNPQPIPALGVGSYQLSVIVDQSTNVTDPNLRADLSQKLYRYNLQQDTNGDGRDEFTSLVTLAQLQSAAGNQGTAATILRQFAWSGDGQSVYWTDSSSSTNFNGLWKVSVAGGAPVRILNTSTDASTSDINAEPAVLSFGGVDKIFLRGGGTTGNVGGIDFVTHDGTTTSARQIAISQAALDNFLEVPSTATVVPVAMSTDADGNLYFNDSGSASGTLATNRRGLYRLDAQGRLSKVISYAERVAAFGGSPNASMFTEQPRTVSYTNGTAAFNVTQVLYKEIQSTNSPNSIGGAYVFKVGDFDRNNVVDQTDIGLFKSKLTVKAGPALAVGDSRYDLNGNGICSFKDVKILQQFYAFPDGDANMDRTVDTVDFNALAGNFGGTAKIWTLGDFNGDEVVDTLDFNVMAANFGQTISSSAGAAALVPEPASLTFIGAGILILGRRKMTK